MTRLLIVAAYASVRAGLHALLAPYDGVLVVEEVGSGAELERVLPEVRPDVVLLYDEAEGDLARVAALLSKGDACLVLLGDAPAGYQRLAAFTLPAWAYLLKEADGQEIAGAIEAVACGLVVLGRGLGPELAPPRVPAAPGEGTFAGDVLTARESEVLQLMAQGLPNKRIAADLGISLHTAKFHVASILAKLGAASRTEAVTLGARRGYLFL